MPKLLGGAVLIFYQSPSVLITDQLFRVHGRQNLAVSIKQLDHVYALRVTQRTTPGWPGRRLWTSAGVAMTSAILVIQDLVSGPDEPLLAFVIALLLYYALWLGDRRRFPPVHELWAVINGRHVCLLRCQDSSTFGQVRRALIRAREHGGGGEGSEKL
jgi:hypothetical protein